MTGGCREGSPSATPPHPPRRYPHSWSCKVGKSDANATSAGAGLQWAAACSAEASPHGQKSRARTQIPTRKIIRRGRQFGKQVGCEDPLRSEELTSFLQSRLHLVCRLLL